MPKQHKTAVLSDQYSIQGHVTGQAVGHLSLTASPIKVYGGQYDTRRGFSPGTSVFPCQYHSTNALCSS